jgi:hypothetical protein
VGKVFNSSGKKFKGHEVWERSLIVLEKNLKGMR